MKKLRVYILKIWGNTRGVHPSLKSAREEARRIQEPTSDYMKGTLECKYSIDLWIQGKEKKSNSWIESFEIPDPDYIKGK